MNWKKTILGLGAAGLLIAGGIFLYQWNKPHRDVQATEFDFEVTASAFVTEYLTDAKAANDKYLAEDGNSRVLLIEGKVTEVDETISGNRIVILGSDSPDLGIKCTFLPPDPGEQATIEIGTVVKVKGVVRAGPSYDEDLDLHEHGSLGDCALVK
jgi:hypothetical protein